MTLSKKTKDDLLIVMEVSWVKYDPYRDLIRYYIKKEIVESTGLYNKYVAKKSDKDYIEYVIDTKTYKSIKIDGQEILVKSKIKKYLLTRKLGIETCRMFGVELGWLSKILIGFRKKETDNE